MSHSLPDRLDSSESATWLALTQAPEDHPHQDHLGQLAPLRSPASDPLTLDPVACPPHLGLASCSRAPLLFCAIPPFTLWPPLGACGHFYLQSADSLAKDLWSKHGHPTSPNRVIPSNQSFSHPAQPWLTPWGAAGMAFSDQVSGWRIRRALKSLSAIILPIPWSKWNLESMSHLGFSHSQRCCQNHLCHFSPCLWTCHPLPRFTTLTNSAWFVYFTAIWVLVCPTHPRLSDVRPPGYLSVY